MSVAGLWTAVSDRQSENGGARPISRLTTHDFHSLAFSPTDPETIFFGHHEGLLVSHNGGKDWQPTTLRNVDAVALAIAPSNPQSIYVAGPGAFVKSDDGGKTWESVPANLPGLEIQALAVDPENAGRLVASVVSFGLFGSEDGGRNWESLSAPLLPSILSLAFGEDDQTLYAAADGAGLWQSGDGGRTWVPIQTLPNKAVITVAYVRRNHRLYVTTAEPSAGLYDSQDEGRTWASSYLQKTLLAVAIDPLNPNRMMAIDDQGEVFASRDGGASWNGR